MLRPEEEEEEKAVLWLSVCFAFLSFPATLQVSPPPDLRDPVDSAHQRRGSRREKPEPRGRGRPEGRLRPAARRAASGASRSFLGA